MATVPQFPAGTLARSALNTFVTETTTNLTDANIAAGANIAISKTALGTYVAPTAYTPAWTAAGTAPSLGNGTITGRYTQIGKLVEFGIVLVFGSTTTMGSATWFFSIPVPASSEGGIAHWGIITATGNDPGVNTYTAIGYLEDVTKVVIANSGGGNQWSVNVPWVQGNGDSVYIKGTYIAA